MKKLYALLLVIAMLATAFVACNGDDEKSEAPSDASTDAASNTSTEASEPEEDKCWLPEKNWNTTILWASLDNKDSESDVKNFEIWCEEDIGDTLSKTVVERSNWLRDTYGITIDLIKGPDGGTVDYAKTAVETDLDLDVISSGAYSIATKLINGHFYDISEVNERYNDGKGWLTLDASYWDKSIIDDITFNNKVFMITGDALISDDESTWVMLFNKDMINDYHYESPYETVKKGEWTLDKLYSYCKEVTKPTGDQLTWVVEDHNKYGLVFQSADTLFFMLGFDQSMIAKDDNDLPVTRFTEERFIDAAQKLVTMMIDDNAVGRSERFGAWNSGVYETEIAIFAAGDAMFMPNQLAVLDASVIKESSVDIGVIPMPKLDENQDDYASSPNMYGAMMISIPITNEEHLEATLFALEAMAWYGEKYINPEYYEKVLKLQKFKDEDAEEMLDLIFARRRLDMGCVYSWGDMIQFYNLLVGRKSTDVVSMYESNRGVYQSAIDNFIDTFNS
jgi:lipoprotein